MHVSLTRDQAIAKEQNGGVENKLPCKMEDKMDVL